jgi:hypothetical protein
VMAVMSRSVKIVPFLMICQIESIVQSLAKTLKTVDDII